jgi:hypothetical protein
MGAVLKIASGQGIRFIPGAINTHVVITMLRRPPFVGRSTASAVFFGCSCIPKPSQCEIRASFAVPSLDGLRKFFTLTAG